GWPDIRPDNGYNCPYPHWGTRRTGDRELGWRTAGSVLRCAATHAIKPGLDGCKPGIDHRS
ncbi:MAG: hypothetical protein L3J02_06810, partial [Henriciella sp.]|nr:hypothetical protein [Henriciella sp.]